MPEPYQRKVSDVDDAVITGWIPPPEPYRPKVGDRVTTTLTGELLAYDAELGIWTLRGEAAGGHILWTWNLHWGTEFQPANDDCWPGVDR